jgi:hypothetical protein
MDAIGMIAPVLGALAAAREKFAKVCALVSI